jgi:hypothetical protein
MPRGRRRDYAALGIAPALSLGIGGLLHARDLVVGNNGPEQMNLHLSSRFDQVQLIDVDKERGLFRDVSLVNGRLRLLFELPFVSSGY